MSRHDNEAIARMFTEVPVELYEEFKETIPTGVRSAVIRALMKKSVEAVKKAGPPMVGALMSGQVSLTIDDSSNQ